MSVPFAEDHTTECTHQFTTEYRTKFEQSKALYDDYVKEVKKRQDEYSELLKVNPNAGSPGYPGQPGPLGCKCRQSEYALRIGTITSQLDPPRNWKNLFGFAPWY